MNDLRKFIALNARWYVFLEEQDDSTIEAIIRGSSRLTALPHGDPPADSTPRGHGRTGPGPTAQPSRDPVQAAQDLRKLTTEDERRTYVNAAEFNLKELREVARLRGLTRYSKLRRSALVDLLAGTGSDQADGSAPGPETKAPSPPTAAGTEARVTAQRSRSSSPEPPSGIAQPDVDAAVIAARLRETDSEEEGAAHLDAQRLDRQALLAVAAELKLTRVDRLSRAELRRRVLKQAIGARRKFAGLRTW